MLNNLRKAQNSWVYTTGKHKMSTLDMEKWPDGQGLEFFSWSGVQSKSPSSSGPNFLNHCKKNFHGVLEEENRIFTYCYQKPSSGTFIKRDETIQARILYFCIFYLMGLPMVCVFYIIFKEPHGIKIHHLEVPISPSGSCFTFIG